MINAKLIYEHCIEKNIDDVHFTEWSKVCKINLDNDLWDALVIGLCIMGKNENLTDDELGRLYMMLEDCHD